MFNKVAYLSLEGGLPSGDTSLHLGELLNRPDFLLYSLIPDPHLAILLLLLLLHHKGEEKVLNFALKIRDDN